jgi:hypothetical protein
MPLAAPATPARSVLDSAEHSATLISQRPRHHSLTRGVTTPLNCLIIGGESPLLNPTESEKRVFGPVGPHVPLPMH